MVWKTVITASPALVLAVPLLFSFLIALLSRFSKKLIKPFFGAALLLTCFFVSIMTYEVLTAGGWFYTFGAEQSVPRSTLSYFRITFLADGFAALGTLTMSFTALCIGIYSYSFIEKESHLEKYYILYLIILCGVNGMILTSDLFNLFVWFETTTIASSSLIVFNNQRGKSLEAGMKYLILGLVGGIFFLFSIGLMYGQYGALNMVLLSEKITGTFNDKLALSILLIVFATKASSAPFHLWVPDVYGESPGSVGPWMTMTSIGYLFILFRIVVGGFIGSITPEFIGVTLIILGSLSMITGVLMALVQNDLRRLVAYLSISQVGYMLLAVGVGITTFNTGAYEDFGSLAMTGGLFHMINDAIYKSLFFLSIITVIYVTNAKMLGDVRGLAKKLPYTTIFFLIGGLSVAGVPPSAGFYSKFLIYKAAFLYHPLLGLFAVMNTVFILAVVVKVFSTMFLGNSEECTKGKKEKIPAWMFISMMVLAAAVVIFSIMPHVIISEVIVPAVEALVGSYQMI
ncbi:MAG: proton-conducting transporter membrane subunit [Candidatus Natronoplasma sp.]